MQGKLSEDRDVTREVIGGMGSNPSLPTREVDACGSLAYRSDSIILSDKEFDRSTPLITARQALKDKVAPKTPSALNLNIWWIPPAVLDLIK